MSIQNSVKVLGLVLPSAESSQTDPRVRDLEQRVQEAMALPADHRVHFTDLHDALTTLRFHGKPVPQVRPPLHVEGNLCMKHLEFLTCRGACARTQNLRRNLVSRVELAAYCWG